MTPPPYAGVPGGWEDKTHKGRRSTSRHRNLARKDDIRLGGGLLVASAIVTPRPSFQLPRPLLRSFAGWARCSKVSNQDKHTNIQGAPRRSRGGGGLRGALILAWQGSSYHGKKSGHGQEKQKNERASHGHVLPGESRLIVAGAGDHRTMLVGTLTPGRGLEHSEPLHVFPDLTETLPAGRSAFWSAETAGGRQKLGKTTQRIALVVVASHNGKSLWRVGTRTDGHERCASSTTQVRHPPKPRSYWNTQIDVDNADMK
ncbi:uncharacterized protein VDAG_01719 [Verticillium dahliae VdLs.17]|uniref:Uncharacterized protein n=1 Tax=Verticillium dahliae (strain VdLs.17 / ATCC MYA-4575 / FGSC 10137) TaxID=498257 RepID=G2WVT3_VERDV|nr:uncharacterized protein VDAG_01719 [Verticillium dahliae VdLs.17]EGY19703.1 hypothetical protein VDAG_01719 [Verticillium dahliae VdLs.17]